MCEWYRRNYACGHHFTGASEWCYRYSQTQKRCKVVVTQVDYDASVCKSCMKKGHKTEVPWEHMIDRTKWYTQQRQHFERRRNTQQPP
ncbi:hypothetical protein CGCS363_v012560 [Colletotrichum siamense]|uniref:uncharacterized protein n=1 Tax=Colletotrichum siamense TaxID=690259 RepID=UPI001872585C|nr:uncharacterized protein CGCS363_v012560 [Colletotrichum siamense]KAF5489196.1 hypothetical protein CGCS363_v012560 [Colletotrichum siamense]